MVGVSQDIINDCIKGKRKATNKLYSQYCDAMYCICLRMLGNRTDAEDVLQKSFIDVFKKLHQYRYEASLGSWIKRLVINNCISFIRSRKRMIEWEEVNETNLQAPEDSANESLYTVEDIKNGMKFLSDGYRVIMTLYLFEGLTHKEIGEYLNISAATSKSQYSRAKKRLISNIRMK